MQTQADAQAIWVCMVIWVDVPLTAEVLNYSTPADQDTYIVYTMYCIVFLNMT